MKVAKLRVTNEVSITNQKIPEITDDEVLVKVTACGICGTDIHKAKDLTVPVGTVLGHEYAGTIARVGKNVETFKEGDCVTGAIHVPCYACHQCQRGNYTLCPQFKQTNIDPGGFAEYIRLSKQHVDHLLFHVPEGISSKVATLAEPVACCINGQKKLHICAGDRVLVMGAGPIGLIHGQLLKQKHIEELVMTDVSDYRLAKAVELGADWVVNPTKTSLIELMKQNNHPGFDRIIIAAGLNSLLVDATSYIRPGGEILCFSPFSTNTIEINASKFFRDELSIIGSYSVTPYDFKEALLALKQETVNYHALITHEFPLKEMNQALEIAMTSQSIKTIITMEDE